MSKNHFRFLVIFKNQENRKKFQKWSRSMNLVKMTPNAYVCPSQRHLDVWIFSTFWKSFSPFWNSFLWNDQIAPATKIHLEAEFANFNSNVTLTELCLLRIGDKLWIPSCATKLHRTIHFCDTILSTLLLCFTLHYYSILLLTSILYNNINKTNSISQTISVWRMIMQNAQHAEPTIMAFPLVMIMEG